MESATLQTAGTDQLSLTAGAVPSQGEVTFGQAVQALSVRDARRLTSTEAEGDQYLQLLKDAMRVHMYAPQANASSGLEVLRELEKRNSSQALHGHYRQQAPGFCRSPGTTCILQEEHYLATPRARSRRNILSCRSDPDRLNLRLRGESRSASLRLN